ncbi:unnamed protein product, partial [Closterium sp. NIES-53]
PPVGSPTAPPPLGLAAPPESAPLVSAPPEPAPPVATPPKSSPSVSAPPGSAPAVLAPESTAVGCGGGKDGRGGKPGGVSKRGERRVAAVSSAAGSPPSPGPEESEETHLREQDPVGEGGRPGGGDWYQEVRCKGDWVGRVWVKPVTQDWQDPPKPLAQLATSSMDPGDQNTTDVRLAP